MVCMENSVFAWICKYAKCGDVHIAINNKRLTELGLISMLDYYTKRCVTC